MGDTYRQQPDGVDGQLINIAVTHDCGYLYENWLCGVAQCYLKYLLLFSSIEGGKRGTEIW